MRIDGTRIVVACALLLAAATAPLHAQAPPAPTVQPARQKPVQQKPQPKPPPAPKAPPKPPPAPPKPAPPPAADPEDEAIIEQLELFMLMEMLKDYEILREPDK